MDSFFNQLYSLADDDMEIVKFANFCKMLHGFVNCNEFFIDMLMLFLQKQDTTIQERRSFFCKTLLRLDQCWIFVAKKI